MSTPFRPSHSALDASDAVDAAVRQGCARQNAEPSPRHCSRPTNQRPRVSICERHFCAAIQDFERGCGSDWDAYGHADLHHHAFTFPRQRLQEGKQDHRKNNSEIASDRLQNHPAAPFLLLGSEHAFLSPQRGHLRIICLVILLCDARGADIMQAAARFSCAITDAASAATSSW